MNLGPRKQRGAKVGDKGAVAKARGQKEQTSATLGSAVLAEEEDDVTDAVDKMEMPDSRGDLEMLILPFK